MKSILAFAVLLLALLSLPLQAAPVSVSGRILDSDGKAVANAKALLVPVLPEAEQNHLELEGKAYPEPAASVATDAAGAFRLTAPDVGMWKVRVDAAGFVSQEALLLPLLEETELPEVRLARDIRFQARVTDPQGRPLAGARVRVSGPRASFSPETPWRTAARVAVTDTNGAATFPKGKEETLTFRATAPGFPLTERKDVREGSVTLRLTPGLTRRLQVRDSQGKPVAGVFVLFNPASGGSWVIGRTSEAGVLDLVLPDRGGVELLLAADDGRRLTFRLKAARPGPQQAPDVAALPAAGLVTGKVVSARDGRPLAGALAWSSDHGAAVRTGADGVFRIPSSGGNDQNIHAAAAGFLPQDGRIVNGRAPTLPLQPTFALAGVVVDESGRPVQGADLKTSLQMNPRLMNNPSAFLSGGLSRSAESGRFRLGNLLPDFGYDLKVTRPGFAPLKMELPAREAGQRAPDLRIVLRSGRTAFGKVLDGAQRPIAGARVFLQPGVSGGLSARLRQSRNPERFEGTSDTAGRFEVKSLPAGTYDLVVQSRGFAPLTVPGLVVPEGKGATDLGTVMLSPGLTLKGIVTDSKGAPVIAAEVRASATEKRDAMRAFSRQPETPADATTQADGSFVLEDRAPGESLDLSVSHPGYGPGSAPGVAVPSEQPVRIVLQATARVSGKVTGPDRKPVAGAQVAVMEMSPASFGGMSRLMPGRPRRTVTDEEGAFVVEGVSPGAIEVSASAPRRQQARLEGLEVKPGQELSGIDILLLPGGVVEGRVLSPDGRPVPGAEVSVIEPSTDGMGISRFSQLRAMTDGDGQYSIDGVPPGPRTVEANAEGYRRAVREVEVTPEPRSVDLVLERGLEVSGRVVDDAGNPVASVDVSLIAGQNFFDAPRAMTGADGAFTIAGVQDGTYRLMARKEGYTLDGLGESVTVSGAPVAGIELKLSSGGMITGRLSGVELNQLSRVRVWANFEMNSGRVDPEGNYQIPNLRPGSWEVTAVVPNTSLRATGRVTLEPGAKEARLDLQFGDGYELRGIVLRNGEPVASAALTLVRTGTVEGGMESTDHQGSFRFGGLQEGAYKLTVSTPNGAHHEEKVDIAGDREIRVELRTASLSGRVIDSLDQSPVSGVRISLEPAQPGDQPLFLPDTQTDARGTFRMLEVGSGAWKLKAARDGYAPAERELQVDGSTPEEIELSLQPTEGVTVEALLPSGQAPDRIQVAVLGPQGETVASGSYPTGENGRTRISNVPPGRWELLVQSDVAAAAPVTVSVPGPPVRVVLPSSGMLRLKVPALVNDSTAKVVLTGAGGAPFRGIDFGGQARSEWELFGGQVGFSRVPAGVWRVTVKTPDGRSWNGTATVTAGGTAEVTLE